MIDRIIIAALGISPTITIEEAIPEIKIEAGITVKQLIKWLE
jgi:hypothetical protein